MKLEKTSVSSAWIAHRPDDQVRAVAYQEGRVLVTGDRDFGELAFRLRHPHAGVIYIRCPTLELAAKVERLAILLDQYSDRLDEFIVVTPNRVRVRRP